MQNQEQRIQSLTPYSIERLHVANQIRDILIINTDLLKSMNILKVLAFSSAITGKASETSDLDIAILIKRKENQEYLEFVKEKRGLRKKISLMFKNLPFPISFRSMQESEDNKVVHITEVSVDNNNEVPFYAQDSISLWEG